MKKGTYNTPEVSVLIRKDGKLLFLLRANTGYCDGFYCLPGGHVEPGENFRSAADRESFEEVGVRLMPEGLQSLHTMQRISAIGDIRIGMFFLAEKWTGEPRNMEPARHNTLVWLAEEGLPYDKIMPFQAAGLRHIAQNEKYSELGWE